MEYSKPLVSIVMMLYNGERWLADALRCLLNQTYNNFELLVLDNQSTDASAAIVKSFAENDPRIHYRLDDRRRDPQDAANQLIAGASGKYCMIACDDDHWHPDFLAVLVERLEAEPRLGLVFCGYDLIDENDRSLGDYHIRPHYRATHSCLRNVLSYLEFRNPLLGFGLFRTQWLQQVLPFIFPDPDCWWNADNVYMLAFLARHRVHVLPRQLFSYRQKDRAKYMPLGWRNGKAWFRSTVRHQWRVSRAFWRVISRAPLSRLQKMVVHCYIPINYFNKMITWRLVGYLNMLLRD